jgi:hypothetical protein
VPNPNSDFIIICLQNFFNGCCIILILLGTVQGTLPFRILAAEYGADITYGQEIVDHKIVKCYRQMNGVSLFDLFLFVYILVDLIP